ncbi:MAG TPA: hypothetical protein VFW47_01595 [Phenylobacterium sp.]|nr:hypothetical protein [Phenylobacterium sp.]
MSTSPALAAAAATRHGDVWPDTFQARLQVLTQLQQLNADLLARHSATATLQHWCEVHGVAAGFRIAARRVADQDHAAGPAEREALGVGPDAPLRFRRVRLVCGDRVLSVADNWYRPDRLSAEMNRALDDTETPFGEVARSLDYRRRTLSAELLFRPLPTDWETAPRPAEVAGARLEIPENVMRHRAVLSTPDGAAISLVTETYTDQVLFRPTGV